MGKKRSRNRKNERNKIHRQLLKDTFEAVGISTKGFSKTLDRLRQRTKDEIDNMVNLIQQDGYTPEMVEELYSKKWADDVKRSGGKKGQFKSEAKQRAFENRYIQKYAKEQEKRLKEKQRKNPTDKTPTKFISEEITALKVHKGSKNTFKGSYKKIEQNRVFSPDIRQKKYSGFVRRTKHETHSSWTKHDKKLVNTAENINKEMGIYRWQNGRYEPYLDSSSGYAVMSQMEIYGKSRTQAMQDYMYSRIDALQEKYEMPTEIPNGITVTSSRFDLINDNRYMIGLPPIDRDEVDIIED